VVQVQNVTTTLDRYAKPLTVAYTTVATVRGQVSQVSGKDQPLVEALATGGRLQEVAAILSLTWGTALNEDQVVLIAGRRWSVAWVDDQTTLAASLKAVITRRRVAADDQKP